MEVALGRFRSSRVQDPISCSIIGPSIYIILCLSYIINIYI